MNDSWMNFVTLAQGQPEAGAAPATTAAQPVNPVGVPGTSGSTTGTTGTSQTVPQSSSGGGGLGSMVWLFPVLLLMMVLMTTMTGRKDKKKRAELLSSLSKHDRVQMMGGEIGTVIELTPEEVVLRVEEGRIRFARSAVTTILTPSKSKAESGAIAEVKGEAKATSV